jgi:hypothetical protein
MGTFNIGIADRFGGAFGAAAQRLAITALGLDYRVAPNAEGTTAQKQNNFNIAIAGAEDEVQYFSKLGTPIFDRVVFSEEESGLNYEFELPPLIDLELDKRLTVTSINDNDFIVANVNYGEVVESWGSSNWDITFRGILVDMDNHKRPLDQLALLLKAFVVDKPIVATCNLFKTVGIREIITKKISLPNIEGFRDTQPFVITARSYAPAELLLNQF